MLDKGSVREFSSPAELMKTGGLFYKLVKEAGLENSVPGYGGMNGDSNGKVEEVKQEREREQNGDKGGT